MSILRSRDGRFPLVEVNLQLRPGPGGTEPDVTKGLQISVSALSRGNAAPGAELDDSEYRRGPNVVLPFFAKKGEDGRPTGELDDSEAVRRLEFIRSEIDGAIEIVRHTAANATALQAEASRAAAAARRQTMLTVTLGVAAKDTAAAKATPVEPPKAVKPRTKKSSVPDHAYEVGGTPAKDETPPTDDGLSV